MRHPKYYLYLNPEEYRQLLYALVEFKNKLYCAGRYTEPIHEPLIKISKATVLYY